MEHALITVLQSSVKVRAIARYPLDKYLQFPILDKDTQPSNCTNGELRLSGAVTTNQGRLEVCMNGAWGSVCDSQGVFTTDEAKVACRQLGKLQNEGKCVSILYTSFRAPDSSVLDKVDVLNVSMFTKKPTATILLDKIGCVGVENRLFDCSYTTVHMCSHNNDVGIICHRELLSSFVFIFVATAIVLNISC